MDVATLKIDPQKTPFFIDKHSCLNFSAYFITSASLTWVIAVDRRSASLLSDNGIFSDKSYVNMPKKCQNNNISKWIGNQTNKRSIKKSIFSTRPLWIKPSKMNILIIGSIFFILSQNSSSSGRDDFSITWERKPETSLIRLFLSEKKTL